MSNLKILDNITSTVRDDLRVEIKKGSKVSIAAACFSMYAYKELKKQLESVDEFRFIFTSPTFVKEKAEKQKREFYIPRLSRETSLYGTEFEIKLRNEMTQRAIAKECADWIRKKAKFKSNTTGENMAGFMTVDSKTAQTAYMPINGFTTVDIGCERGNNSYNMVNCMEAPFAQQYMQLFDGLWNDREKMQDVTDMVLENISTAYAENSPEFIYFMTLYHVFSEFLDDISEDELPNEATGFKQSKIWSMLYDFQRDAVLAIINKLEKYNGCILADSVGLGKTFTALAVVKYYENRNKSVLVLCPKKLAENWNTYKDNYVNNPIASDRLNYDVLFHTDLSRNGGQSNGLDLNRLNWGNYDLVVIDESHNFRNGIGTHSKTQDNRYQRLMDKVIRSGVKTKVLMLSATPVNNRFVDLKNQLALAYEGNSEFLDERLNTSKNVEDMSDGISIMDLGLNEFRLDLLDYIKRNGDMDKKPRGLHAVVPATDELPDGVIFVLKNINNSVNVDNRNRIHPFYMVYIGVDGQIICDYLNVDSIGFQQVPEFLQEQQTPVFDKLPPEQQQALSDTVQDTLQMLVDADKRIYGDVTGKTLEAIAAQGYSYKDGQLEKQQPEATPDSLLTGETVRTPRGNFHITDMSREQIEAAGFGFHHASEDGKYLIMGNGTQAYAIAAEQPQRDNPLKHVEDTIEQNDNNFDGLINNTPQTPTVADFEQRAKAGEAISVTDLAKAVKAEKREQPQKKPSILKKLDEYKKQAAQQPKDKQKEHKKDLEV